MLFKNKTKNLYIYIERERERDINKHLEKKMSVGAWQLKRFSRAFIDKHLRVSFCDDFCQNITLKGTLKQLGLTVWSPGIKTKLMDDLMPASLFRNYEQQSANE